MKKSLLALAVSLVAASGAHAAWDKGGSADALVGNGETLLVIFDENVNHQVSYAQDLGDKANYDLYRSNISNSAFTQSWSLDATALSVFSTSNLSDLRWAVVSIHNGALDPNFTGTGIGFQATTNAAPSTKPTPTDIGNVINVSGILSNAVNGVDANYATNVATTQNTLNGNYLGDPGTFGRQFKQSQSFDLTAGVGQTLGYYEFEKTGSGRTTNSSMAQFAGQWSLDLGTNNLVYNAQSTPTVPVPAAAWLMGSALVGLGSVARRRRA